MRTAEEGAEAMLVLSRQRDETIMIGDEVEITVVDIRGDKVRLGITAPTRISVHRKEVYEAIKRENEQAARFQRSDIEAVGLPISPGPARTRIARAAGLLAQASPRTEPRVPGTDRPQAADRPGDMSAPKRDAEPRPQPAAPRATA